VTTRFLNSYHLSQLSDENNKDTDRKVNSCAPHRFTAFFSCKYISTLYKLYFAMMAATQTCTVAQTTETKKITHSIKQKMYTGENYDENKLNEN